MSEPAEYPSYPVEPSRPPRPPATGHLVGRVDGAATRVESYGHERSSETVLSFRLLDAGERPVEVELRGTSLAGTVRDGDWVEVVDQRRNGRIEVAALANLTTGSQVTAVGSARSAGARVFKVVFLLVFLAILAVIVVVVIKMATDPFGLF